MSLICHRSTPLPQDESVSLSLEWLNTGRCELNRGQAKLDATASSRGHLTSESRPFTTTMPARIQAGGWTTRCLEENPLRRVGRETEAGSALRRSFLSIWSEILRSVRRRDRANSKRAMQPPSRRNLAKSLRILSVRGAYLELGPGVDLAVRKECVGRGLAMWIAWVARQVVWCGIRLNFATAPKWILVTTAPSVEA